jgi:Kef-type K+ transport system membrane component KefB
MVETGYNRTELGKIILAACFINDIGTVLALGLIFANYNVYLLVFVVVTIAAIAILPWIVPLLFAKIGKRASEPEIKFLFLVLFGLGGLANLGKSEAVLPAYLVGMALAPFFMGQRELQLRMRAICFAFLTPFYFLKAGSLIEAHALVTGAGLISVFLGMKMLTKFFGILPLTRYFKFERREGMYTTLMMSTGLTFGSISALFGLTNNIIDQVQYTILVTVVIGSAVVPTLIAQIWFHPHFEPLEEDAQLSGIPLIRHGPVEGSSLRDSLASQPQRAIWQASGRVLRILPHTRRNAALHESVSGPLPRCRPPRGTAAY